MPVRDARAAGSAPARVDAGPSTQRRAKPLDRRAIVVGQDDKL